MATLTLAYEGITLRASLERAADVQWLEEFFLPWFDRSADAPDVEVLVSRDPARYKHLLACDPAGARVKAFMMDNRAVEFPVWNVPGEQLALHDEKHRMFFLITGKMIQLVCGDREGALRLNLMRVLRELAMGVAQLRSGRFLHASAIAVEGRALVITGPRQAGKTSLLTYLLANSPAQFLCNDRLLVKWYDGSIRLHGMPTIVSLRDGTLDLFPGMRQSIENQRFTTRATLAEACASRALPQLPPKEGRHSLSPHQYCSLLDCAPVQAATGAALLFPRQTGQAGGLELVPLHANEARIRLGECLFGHIGPDRLSEAFTLLPGALARITAPDDAALCAGLASDLPAYDCLLGNDTYDNDRGAGELLQRLLYPATAAAAIPTNIGTST
jgi:hypothetical protein